MSGRPLIACAGLAVHFGGVRALDGVDFSAEPGAITAIIGPNGAGKTTLINAITGMVPVRGGSIALDGEDITALPTHKRSRKGVVRTFQNLEIFSNMSVMDNVMTGCHSSLSYSTLAGVLKTPGFWAGEKRIRKEAEKHLDFVGLWQERHTPAGDLPFGSQRLLELARALAARPRLLLLDEPAAGLNIRETRRLGGLIREILDNLGVSIVIVEHDMDLVMRISHHITVLSFGRAITRGKPAEVQQNPEVIAAYLGADDED